MPGSSAVQPATSTASSDSSAAGESSRFSTGSAPGAGSRPIGDSTAPARPSQRSAIHARTRLFSPKPGHRKRLLSS
jgi:hypothetical protein